MSLLHKVNNNLRLKVSSKKSIAEIIKMLLDKWDKAKNSSTLDALNLCLRPPSGSKYKITRAKPCTEPGVYCNMCTVICISLNRFSGEDSSPYIISNELDFTTKRLIYRLKV